jgi:hypothetical protein
MDKLLKIHPTQWAPQHTARLNNADDHITRLMLRAKKIVKKETLKARWRAKNYTSPTVASPTGTTSKSRYFPPENTPNNTRPQTPIRQNTRALTTFQIRNQQRT